MQDHMACDTIETTGTNLLYNPPIIDFVDNFFFLIWTLTMTLSLCNIDCMHKQTEFCNIFGVAWQGSQNLWGSATTLFSKKSKKQKQILCKFVKISLSFEYSYNIIVTSSI